MKKYDLGKTLKVLIEANNMSVKNFAQEIGVDEETVNYYIYDEVSPSESVLKKHGKSFGSIC